MLPEYGVDSCIDCTGTLVQFPIFNRAVLTMCAEVELRINYVTLSQVKGQWILYTRWDGGEWRILDVCTFRRIFFLNFFTVSRQDCGKLLFSLQVLFFFKVPGHCTLAAILDISTLQIGDFDQVISFF